MKNYFEPQILFLFNSKGKIFKTYFLTFNNDKNFLLKSKHYSFFTYMLTNEKNLFENNDYYILNNHILLTLNLTEARGYIQKHILENDLKIILFSYFGNLDYSTNDNSIFNPFEDSLFYKNPDTSILYDINPSITNLNIFCVVDEENIKNNKLCLDGIYNENIYLFVKSIMEEDISSYLDLNITYETPKIDYYSINLDYDIIQYLKSNKKYIKIINDKTLDNIFISGDKFILFPNENLDKYTKYNKLQTYIEVKSKLNLEPSKNNILIIDDNLLTVYDKVEFDTMLKEYNLLKENLIKQKNLKQNVKIFYNILINANLEKFFNDYDTPWVDNNFFISSTKKTKNIYSDRSKKINLMTSSTHILFSSSVINYKLFIYITKFIIGLQSYFKLIVFIEAEKKKGKRYYSRYCQGSRNPNVIDEITDILDYKNFNDIYFENIYNEGDVYYDKATRKYYICNTPNLTNIGFINELYKGYNKCLPCCYKKPKNDTSVFKNCIVDNDEKSKLENIVINPFIHIFKNYRIIMDKTHIGLLLNKINLIFNKNLKIVTQRKNKIKEIEIDSEKKIFKDILKKDLVNNKKIRNLNILLNNGFKKIKNTNIFINELDEFDFDFKFKNKNIDELKIEQDIVTHEYTDNKYLDKLFRKETKNPEKFTNNNIRSLYKYYNDFDCFLLINKQNRIELAKNFVIYTINSDLIDIDSIEDIKNIKEPNIYFYNDEIYFNKNLIHLYNTSTTFFQDLKFLLIIQNKLHAIRVIQKRDLYSKIDLMELSTEQKKNIFNELIDVAEFKIDKQVDDFYYNNYYFEIDNKKTFFEDLMNGSYVFIAENILLDKNSIGYYITYVLYKNYFNIFYCDEKELINIKKIFLYNLKNFLGEDINLNKKYIKEENIEFMNKLLKILNPKYITQTD